MADARAGNKLKKNQPKRTESNAKHKKEVRISVSTPCGGVEIAPNVYLIHFILF